jgi:hypothetical protein
LPFCDVAFTCGGWGGGVRQLEEGTSLLKALNILMLKILENSRRNYSFASLLRLLRTPPPAVAEDAAAGGGVGAVPAKFSDLVVKCLIKLTKALGAALGEVRTILKPQPRAFSPSWSGRESHHRLPPPPSPQLSPFASPPN